MANVYESAEQLIGNTPLLSLGRLKEKLGHLDDGMMNSVNSAIAVSFGLSEPNHNVAVATNENGGVIA